MSLINLVCSMIRSSPVVGFEGLPLRGKTSTIEHWCSHEG